MFLFCVEDASGEPIVSPCPNSDDIIQGYLFKRSRRKSKTWKRYALPLSAESVSSVCFVVFYDISPVNLFQMLVFHPRQPAHLQEVAQGTTERMFEDQPGSTRRFSSQGSKAAAVKFSSFN